MLEFITLEDNMKVLVQTDAARFFELVAASISKPIPNHKEQSCLYCTVQTDIKNLVSVYNTVMRSKLISVISDFAYSPEID